MPKNFANVTRDTNLQIQEIIELQTEERQENTYRDTA